MAISGTGLPRDVVFPAVLLALVLICYSNSLYCGFAFDDREAIVKNRDLRPEASVLDLFFNDFWGTPMHKERSHKSYRPLCVLTFRLNYFLGQLNPWGYHLTNLLLHWVVCLLYLKACRLVLSEGASEKASLLLAVHAVHTEAVTGVVGRAELLSSTFMLLAFMAYSKAAENTNKTNWNSMFVTVTLVVMATLSKEQGITVVGICCVYEVFYLQKFNLLNFIRQPKASSTKPSKQKNKSPRSSGLGKAWPRIVFLLISTLVLLWGRINIMGARIPSFTRFDNPAAMAPFPTRHMTFLYLLPVNAWLLLSPVTLICDWTMGTIPLVTSLSDPRNLATASLLCCVGALGLYGLLKNGTISRQLLVALSFLIIPFIPASNLFFPVGFVVAERVLYAPSMGFCMLVAIAMEEYQTNLIMKRIIASLFALLLVLHAGRTIRRNRDWESELTLFQSALRVTENNAKVWNNVGHALEAQTQWEEALKNFKKAASIQPDDIGAWMNMGRAYRHLGKLSDSEAAYRKAVDMMPKTIPGQHYVTQIDPNHLNVYLNLANLIKDDESRLKEAEELYLKVIGMRPDFVEAYINQGELLLRQGKLDQAESLYQQAVNLEPLNADVHFNLGVVSMRKREKQKALKHFDRAVELNPSHKMALYNSALYIQESGNVARRQDAVKRLEKVVELDPESELSYSTLGMLAMDDDNNQAAVTYYQKALQINPTSRHALFNIALIHSDAKKPLEAKPYLETLLQHHANHTKSMLLLGDIYLNSLKDVSGATQMFQRIVDLEPSNIQAQHNLCVILVQRGRLHEAEKCLLDVLKLAPQADYIKKNLGILRHQLSVKGNSDMGKVDRDVPER